MSGTMQGSCYTQHLGEEKLALLLLIQEVTGSKLTLRIQTESFHGILPSLHTNIR